MSIRETQKFDFMKYNSFCLLILENWVIYREYCLKVCPSNTYDVEKQYNETYKQKHCLPCSAATCPKSCQLKDDESIEKHNLYLLEGCEELKGNLKIHHPSDLE